MAGRHSPDQLPPVVGLPLLLGHLLLGRGRLAARVLRVVLRLLRQGQGQDLVVGHLLVVGQREVAGHVQRGGVGGEGVGGGGGIGRSRRGAGGMPGGEGGRGRGHAVTQDTRVAWREEWRGRERGGGGGGERGGGGWRERKRKRERERERERESY